METTKPFKTWHADDPPASVLEAFQARLGALAGRDVDVYLEETETEQGSWPYTDRIHTRTYTLHSLTAHAVAEWEEGHNDGAMQTWTFLTVKLYGADQALHDIFDDFFRQHFQ